MAETRERQIVQTADGSVDWHGKPSIRGKSGGWLAGMLLLVNQGLVTLAFFGVGANLVLFMTRVMHLDNADAANQVSYWAGTAYVFSIVGAFISDSYWGRYKTCIVFQIIFFLGLVELSFSSYILLRKTCDSNTPSTDCRPPSRLEILIFYMSIYQIALGNGAYQPAITTFGADQFDEEFPEEKKSKMSFFSYFFMANNIGSLFSDTALTYLQDKGQWVLAFGIAAGSAFLALMLFFVGTLRFRYFKPGGNPLIRVSQVIVASAKNWKVKVPKEGAELYEVEGKKCAMNEGRKIVHTPDFRCLDKAAMLVQGAQQPESSKKWRLCTVTQVEEVKCILRLLPIWLCTIIYSVAYNQMSSVFIEQGEAMNTSLSKLHIPPGSMNIFEIFGVSAFVLLYQFVFSPLTIRVFKKDLTELQRIGIGLIVAALAMLSAGIVEIHRRKHAIDDSSSMTILWQIPQYALIGASEVYSYVGMMEFFNQESPDGLKSFAGALYVASMSAGSYMSSLMVTIVMKLTDKGTGDGWISQNLNKGHMDRFYFLIGLMNAMDLILFVVCAKRYRSIEFDATGDELAVNGNGNGEVAGGTAQAAARTGDQDSIVEEI